MTTIEELRKMADERDVPKSIQQDLLDFIERLPNLMTEDWDQEGAIAISIETTETAFIFLKKSVIWIEEKILRSLQVMDLGINPCCDGSIDIKFDQKDFGLLININPNKTFTYYGHIGPVRNLEFEIQLLKETNAAYYRQPDFIQLFKKAIGEKEKIGN